MMIIIIITSLCLGTIACIAGLLLFAASRKFSVIENPLIAEVEALLPGVNCGACGLTGCRAFAEALVDTEDSELFCPVGGEDTRMQIAEKLGFQMTQGAKRVARVMCQGGDKCTRTAHYMGIRACAAVDIANLSDIDCPFGCLGYGDCLKSCPFNCIHIENNLAHIDENCCTGCGNCVKVCPRNLIELVPYDKKVYVACRSVDKGAETRKYCSMGCIGCKMCVKACEFDAILLTPFLAKIDPEKCTQCLACVDSCPTHSIKFVLEKEAISSAHENSITTNKRMVNVGMGGVIS